MIIMIMLKHFKINLFNKIDVNTKTVMLKDEDCHNTMY